MSAHRTRTRNAAMTLKRHDLRLLLVILLAVAAAALSGRAQAQSGPDYYPPEVLDKPLGITRLANGNTLIADAGGANYTTTDSAILEVDPSGQVVWLYAGPMAFAHSATPYSDGSVLITDTGNDRVLRVKRDANESVGRGIIWSSDDWSGGSGLLSDGSHLDYPNDAELLANGHILIGDRNNDRVLEVTEDGQVVWVYDDLVRPHNPDRLDNGNTIVSDSERNLIIEVDPAGNIVWQYGTGGELDWPRDADRLANGNTLITDSRHNRVIEVTPSGEIVWEFGGLAIPYEADRLENGNTLISDNNHKRVIEVNPAGEIVWTFRNIVENLPSALQNGGFEKDDDGNGLPDGWYPADLNAEGPATFIWDAAEKRSGKYSAGLEYHGPGRVAWLQVVEVTPGTTYNLAGDIKTQIIGGVAAYQIWFVDPLGGPLGEPTTVQAYTSSTDWTHNRLQITAPPEATSVQIWALSLADGRVWFDNVSFRPARFAGGWPLWAGVAAILLIGGAGTWLLVRRRRASENDVTAPSPDANEPGRQES
jgi:hypothetical protein